MKSINNKIKRLKRFLSTHIPSISWEYDNYNKELFHAQNEWNRTLFTKINQISAIIFKETLYDGANVILISPDMVDLFKNLEF